jgi:hypothetical protein
VYSIETKGGETREFVKRGQEKESSVLVCALCVCFILVHIFCAYFGTETVSGLVPSAVVIVSRLQ